METRPLVSIITVVYNSVNDIENTILSVIGQSYENIEFVVIDGGSTDGTLAVINRYISNINIVVSEADKGVYDAMNKAIDICSGEWINFMNAGDFFSSNNILAEIFEKEIDPKISFLYSDFYVMMSNGGELRLFEASINKGVILHQSVIYRKSLHNEIGKYAVTDKIIVADYLFFNLINPKYCKKFNNPISVNKLSGISSGKWCWQQKLCVDFIFGRIKLSKFVYEFILTNIKYSFRRAILSINNLKSNKI
jgi:glycosyltransferase involved in cell wall biosynthesis